MQTYKCLINSTAGLAGTLIKREPTCENTRALLERGIIAEVKVEQPAEVKRVRKNK